MPVQPQKIGLPAPAVTKILVKRAVALDRAAIPRHKYPSLHPRMAPMQSHEARHKLCLCGTLARSLVVVCNGATLLLGIALTKSTRVGTRVGIHLRHPKSHWHAPGMYHDVPPWELGCKYFGHDLAWVALKGTSAGASRVSMQVP